MMEEVPIGGEYDSHTTEQASEDEILACLVDQREPKAKVPPKKAKLKQGEDESKPEDEDPIDRYQRENKKLLQASLRLEQENDSLAHRLVTSKIALRTSLDEAEDTVDDLTKQLHLTRQRLQASEEQMKTKQEEADLQKDDLQRQLDNAEQAVQRSSRIVADYKQICSQLNQRLEDQQASHREEVEALKSVVKECPVCSALLKPREEASAAGEGGVSAATEDGPGAAGGADPGARRSAEQYALQSRRAEQEREEQRSRREKEALEAQVRGLEKELAQTKLRMVEANCTIQELEHQNGIMSVELQDAKNSWFAKTFNRRRASSGGLHSLGESRDEPPWLAGWSAKKLSWVPKENPGV